MRADDGAVLAEDAVQADRQAAGIRQQVSPFLGPNAAAIRAAQALRTQNDGGQDPTVEAVKVAQRNPIPLVPGALRG